MADSTRTDIFMQGFFYVVTSLSRQFRLNLRFTTFTQNRLPRFPVAKQASLLVVLATPVSPRAILVRETARTRRHAGQFGPIDRPETGAFRFSIELAARADYSVHRSKPGAALVA